MAITAATLQIAFGKPPEEAIAYLKGKGLAVTDHWHDLLDEAHARAFTVAKVGSLDLLQDLRNGLLKSLTGEGMTQRQFIDAMTPVLQAKGWWGKQVRVDPLGNAQVVQLGSAWRLSTIYQTNMQSAYMAGRHSAMMAAAATHPYWMYVAVMDARTRPAHAALNGRIYRCDDPIWNSIFPPNGYRCRCRVVPLTQDAVERNGWTVSSSTGHIATAMREVGVNPRTGEVIHAPVTTVRVPGPDGKPMLFSPDPGFNSAPSAGYQPRLDSYDTDLAQQYVKAMVPGPPFTRFAKRQADAVAQVQAHPVHRARTAQEKAAAVTRGADPNERFPMGVLPADLTASFGAAYTVAWLDAPALRTLLAQTLAPVDADFQALPALLHTPTVAVQKGQQLILAAPAEHGWRQVTVTHTPHGWRLERIERVSDRAITALSHEPGARRRGGAP